MQHITYINPKAEQKRERVYRLILLGILAAAVSFVLLVVNAEAKTVFPPRAQPAPVAEAPARDTATGIGCCYHAPFQLWEADETPVYITCPGIGGMCENIFESRWYKKVAHEMAKQLQAEGTLSKFPYWQKYL